MTALKLAWLLLALAGSIGPGLLVARRWRMGPLERLTAAAVVSQVILYLVAGLIYVSNAPHWVNVAVVFGCLGCCAAARGEIRALATARQSRRVAAAFGLLFGWVVLVLALVRSYGGGKWALDWAEHYERTHFFLAHQPLGTLFIGLYPLSARPPLMNLLAAHFLAASAERYDFFQVVFSFLNVLALLPAALLCRFFLGRARRDGGAVLFCLFALSPFFLQNATYAWTKSLATFDVIAGLWFYLRGWQREDPRRIALGFVALAAGILVHYSAAPFALFVGAHCAIQATVRRSPRAIAVLLPAAALVGTWVGWSVVHYGLAGTFASNTAVSGTPASSAGFLSRFAHNLWYSLVPHPLRMTPAGFAADYFQPSAIGYLRDYAFTILQTNLVFALGSVAGVAALVLLVRRRAEMTPFWIGLIAVGAAAIAAHPTLDPTGVAHVCSQPLIVLGLIFLAAEFGRLPSWARIALAAGGAVDFAVGAFLHFSLENWTSRLAPGGNGNLVPDLTTDMPSKWAVEGWFGKYSFQFQFLGDHLPGAFAVVQGLVLLGAGAMILYLLGKRQRWAGGICAAIVVGVGVPVMVFTARPRVPMPIPSDLVLQASVAGNPDSAQAWTDAGIALLRQGKVDEALRAWGEGFALDPRPGLARYLPEMIAPSYDLRPLPTAVAAEAVMRNPTSAGAWVNLAGARFSRGHRQPAIAALEEALRLDPENVAAKDGLKSLTK